MYIWLNDLTGIARMPNIFRKSVVVFGGSFNPPTLAHQEIIGRCMSLPDFNEVWLMPSASGYSKKITTTDNERLDMLKIVHQYQFKGDDRLVISEFELANPQLEETYQTVDELNKNYQNNDFWFVFGADSYHDMPNWGEGLRLQNELNMLVFDRNGQTVHSRGGLINLPLSNFADLSSTKARRAVSETKKLDGIVCAEVKDYIIKNSLYK